MLSNLLLAPEFLLLIADSRRDLGARLLWAPLLLALPLSGRRVTACLWRALVSGWRASRPVPGRSRSETLRSSRADGDVVPAAATGKTGRPTPRRPLALAPSSSTRGRLAAPAHVTVWGESWHEPQAWVQCLQDALAARGAFVRSGGPFDRWDLDLRAGPLGGVRIRTAVEEHGVGQAADAFENPASGLDRWRDRGGRAAALWRSTPGRRVGLESGLRSQSRLPSSSRRNRGDWNRDASRSRRAGSDAGAGGEWNHRRGRAGGSENQVRDRLATASFIRLHDRGHYFGLACPRRR